MWEGGGDGERGDGGEEEQGGEIGRGGYLVGVGERFGVRWEAIQALNKLPDDLVYAGEELKLPPQRTNRWMVEPGDCAWEISKRFGLTLEERKSRVVRLVEGDSLWGLGERFGLRWEDIQAFNKLPDDMVYAGEELKLPPQRTKRWVVEPGDCAWEISERFGLTLEELRDVNVEIPEILYPGDVLLVPEDAVLRPRQLWNLRAVKARMKGIAAHANAKFFDVFPYPQDIDNYREKHRLLLNALRHVETSFIMPAPTGDGGLSIGPLQISTEYHQDAWWQASNTVKYEHCEEVDYAERTVINYWLRYCPWALEFGDWETLARTHNGGPCFWHHFSTTRYWRRVKNALRSMGFMQGIPEFSSLPPNNTSIQLFSKHIPFPVPILESKMKDNLNKGSPKLQLTSAVMEAATVGVHE